MAKVTGLDQRLFVGGFNLSGDVGSIDNLSAPKGVLDVTGIDKSAMERLLATSDIDLSFSSFFNDVAGQEHAVLSALPTTDLNLLYAIGSARGDASAMLVGKQINYDPSRAADGGLAIATNVMANGVALEYGEMLTAAQETAASAAALDSLDNAAASSNGIAAMAHVISIATGSLTTLDIQSSSDDGVGDAFADIINFTSLTAGSSERLTVTGAVERYLRVNVTGTFTNAVIAIAVRRGTAQDDVAY